MPPQPYKMQTEPAERMQVHIWMLQPVLFVVAVWMLQSLAYKQTILDTVPSLFGNLWNKPQNDFSAFVPSIPSNPSELLRLGELHQQINESKDQTKINSCLEEFASIIKFSQLSQLSQKLSKDKANEIYNSLGNPEIHKNTLSKIWGFLSFVNVLWVGSILMMVILFFPTLKILFSPLTDLLGNIVIWAIENRYLFDPLLFAVCFALIVEGLRYPESTGMFISFSGYLAFMLMTLMCNSYYGTPLRVTFSLVCTMMVGFPLAVAYQSRLFAFMTVGTFYHLMGFTVVCYGLCWCIGFDSKNTAERCAAVSLLLVVTFFFLRGILPPHFMKPFATPVFTMGTVVYFLAMLIICSDWSWKYGDHNYASHQMVMIISLLGTIAIGSIYGIDTLYNVGITFACMYAMEKSTERAFANDFTIPWLFFLAICGYGTSLFLNTHPQFIISLFDPSFLQKN